MSVQKQVGDGQTQSICHTPTLTLVLLQHLPEEQKRSVIINYFKLRMEADPDTHRHRVSEP